MAASNLVYVGKIIEFTPIENADFIHCATVVCEEGGKWKGIIRKADFALNDLCVVFLPDSQLDPIVHAHMPFMKDSGWRVKMRRFKGSPSEVVIANINSVEASLHILGLDITEVSQVTKYCKPIPAQLSGEVLGNFPSFIPKTDEPNYQSSEELIERLIGRPFYITEKCDGSSSTAYRYKGHFGICSRNLELVRNLNNGYWKVATKYSLEENLPEGIALQWETCGPGVQSNPMLLSELDGFAFSAYDIEKHAYLEAAELVDLCKKLGFPMAKIITWTESFSKEGIERLGEGKYETGKYREGVVVRSQVNMSNGTPISFKVINLDYKD